MVSSSSFSVSTKETWEPLMGPKLIGGERRRLTQFLKAYRNCFAFNMKVLGVLIGHDIWIELANDTLIFCCPYRYSDMERDFIQSQTLCRNPNLGLTPRQRACKVTGQERNLGVTSHGPGNVKNVRE
jgi:hypothetical protein